MEDEGFIQNSRVMPPTAALGIGTVIREAVEVMLTLLANGLVEEELTMRATSRETV